MPELGNLRLGYMDWLRGFACLGMFQVHCYDSWLDVASRKSSFYGWSRFAGTLPGPLFVFLSGVAVALVTDKMRRKGIAANQIAAKTIRRGADIFGLSLLFRVQEFLLGSPRAPWTDLLRVDVLNVIGISIMSMGVVCWLARTRAASAILAAAVALAVALSTPPLWTTWRPHWLPWYLESYINGVHTYDAPQPGLFPIFPWSGFVFAGLAIGFVLQSDWSRENPGKAISLLGGHCGVGLLVFSLWLDARPVQLYAVYDYWHTSPNFFLARVGVLLILTFAAYAWCRWGVGEVGFSPVVQMGQTSLLVYWVHIEFVYGRFSILTKRAQGIAGATRGLLVICAAMVLLSIARTRLKGHGAEILAWLRRALRPAI